MPLVTYDGLPVRGRFNVRARDEEEGQHAVHLLLSRKNNVSSPLLGVHFDGDNYQQVVNFIDVFPSDGNAVDLQDLVSFVEEAAALRRAAFHHAAHHHAVHVVAYSGTLTSKKINHLN